MATFYFDTVSEVWLHVIKTKDRALIGRIYGPHAPGHAHEFGVADGLFVPECLDVVRPPTASGALPCGERGERASSGKAIPWTIFGEGPRAAVASTGGL